MQNVISLLFACLYILPYRRKINSGNFVDS